MLIQMHIYAMGHIINSRDINRKLKIFLPCLIIKERIYEQFKPCKSNPASEGPVKNRQITGRIDQPDPIQRIDQTQRDPQHTDGKVWIKQPLHTVCKSI